MIIKSILAWFFSNLPVFTAAVLLLGSSVLFSGCYTLKQGTTMLGYLNRAVPLEKIARNETASEDERLFVKRVDNIRRFAMEALGLKESKNYTRYVELDRDYLAAVVSASAKDSFTRHEWWFPVVGKVPYKGFFKPEDARKERKKLEKKDLDVWIRRVDAFSTLGWFRDPLYSFMKGYSDQDLAELIIHELFHATVFVKNQAQFNEELAQFVGTEGARLYMEKLRGADPGPEDTAEADSGDADAKTEQELYLAFIRSLIAELDEVYKSEIPREEKLKRKEEIIDKAKADFDTHYDSNYKTDNYRAFSKLAVNNAYLELYRLYYEEDRYYKELYEKSGRDLPKFIAAAKTINNKSNAKVQLEKALGL